MSASDYTPAQRCRRIGFLANLTARGRAMRTDAGPLVICLVDDQPMLSDPTESARAEFPVYVNIIALSGSIKSPRDVRTFTEVRTGKLFTVLEYRETAGDAVTWKWFCEAQREIFNPTPQA